VGTVNANGIKIYFEQVGDPTARPLLLISGLGAQVVGWHPEFIDAIAARGFFVTTFDNRDVGLSTWFDDAGEPDPAEVNAGSQAAAYTLVDMARDAAELVRALELGPVHVVGVSMGGMIAQQFAIDHPELTLSLTSIMSTPDILNVGQPTPEALASLNRLRSEDLDTFLDEEVDAWRLTHGSKYELDVEWVRAQAATARSRADHPAGTARHVAAVVATPDRRPALALVRTPTVVIHGDEDPLVTLSGGEATAAAVPGARLVVLPGVGHSLPVEVWPDVLDEIDGVATP
jgi:pimeloyl-ACP methyl ester carboxylesterase